MKIVETFILCDRCGTAFGVDFRNYSIKQQRIKAKENGWIYKNGKDFCPECKKQKSAL